MSMTADLPHLEGDRPSPWLSPTANAARGSSSLSLAKITFSSVIGRSSTVDAPFD